ncbi:MAG: hypothetical protein FWC26_05735 [Fibromonadales bacterium]|nr:hypothetical protein [Fibromonadales bacterium]
MFQANIKRFFDFVKGKASFCKQVFAFLSIFPTSHSPLATCLAMKFKFYLYTFTRDKAIKIVRAGLAGILR